MYDPMLHRLLACLALITGLSVLSAPVHAREAARATACLEQCATQSVQGVASVRASRIAAKPLPSAGAPARAFQPETFWPAPATLIGPDRALE